MKIYLLTLIFKKGDNHFSDHDNYYVSLKIRVFRKETKTENEINFLMSLNFLIIIFKKLFKLRSNLLFKIDYLEN